MKACPYKWARSFVPLPGRAGEEGLAVGVAVAEASLQAKLILAKGGPAFDLPACRKPEPPSRRFHLVQQHPVETGGADGSILRPSAVSQHLQVPTHRRLRQLQDLAQLDDAQLIALQQPQQAQAGFIGQASHAGNKVRSSSGFNHPCIRIKE